MLRRYGTDDNDDGVDTKHFIRFRGENAFFKFIRLSADLASGNVCML